MTADGDLGEGDKDEATDAAAPPKRPDPESPLAPDRRWGARPDRDDPSADRPTERRRSWQTDPDPRPWRPDAPTITGQPSTTSGGPVHAPSAAPIPPPPQPTEPRRGPTISASPAKPPPPPPPQPQVQPSRARSESAQSAPPAVPVGDLPDRRVAERSNAAVGELAQQLAAMQAQVASLSAQLTTLAHRITYDMERGAQTTSERILRDLGQLPQQVSQQVGAHLGPAIDDLAEQVEADSARLAEVVDVQLTARIASIGDAVDAMPLGNVELMSGLQTLGADLQDRVERFATRVGDQVTALERATTTELARLRDNVAELQTSIGQPAADHDTISRMAGQVERLSERAPGTSEVVDAVEQLINEHLEVLRDGIEARVGALAPALHEELEALRAEALAGSTSADEALAERVEALEIALVERVDTALADQIDALDGLMSDRHAMLLGAVTKMNDERHDELAAIVASGNERIEEVLAAVAELQEGGGAAPDEDALAGIAEELQALRRRITLRFEAGDGD